MSDHTTIKESEAEKESKRLIEKLKKDRLQERKAILAQRATADKPERCFRSKDY